MRNDAIDKLLEVEYRDVSISLAEHSFREITERFSCEISHLRVGTCMHVFRRDSSALVCTGENCCRAYRARVLACIHVKQTSFHEQRSSTVNGPTRPFCPGSKEL
jgi:hypothetical protein